MKLSHALVIAAAAAPGTQATQQISTEVVSRLRKQLSSADFTSQGSGITFLKFYADNFLWSITELYKNFKYMYSDVAALKKQLEKNEDAIEDLEDELDDYDDRIDDLEDAIDDLEDQMEALQEQIAQLQEDQSQVMNDQFFDDTFDGSGAGPWVSADVVDAMKDQMGFDDMSSIDQMMAGMHLDQIEAMIDAYDPSSQDFDAFKDSLKEHFDEANSFQFIRDEEQQLAEGAE
jgi:DNA repair exonuclease SbcCD ATPase subunit